MANYGHTNLLVATLLLSEAALLVENAPTEIDIKVCDLLVEKAKEQLA